MNEKEAREFLYEQVKGGLVQFNYSGAVNNRYFLPMPLACPEPGQGQFGLRFVCEEELPPHATAPAPEKGHDPNTVRLERRQPKKTRMARKTARSRLLAG